MRFKYFVGYFLVLYVSTGLFAQNTITELEYWFDEHIDSKSIVVLEQASSSLNFDENILTPTLENGLHSFHYRLKDSNNAWSVVNSSFFTTFSKDNSDEIIGYEYWFDLDIDNKLFVASTENLNSQSIQVDQLAEGLHLFNYRAINANGNYSIVHSHFFSNSALHSVQPNLVKAYEYWVNDSTETLVYVALDNPVNPLTLSANVPLPVLPIGNHAFNIRFLDLNNHWSVTQTQEFNVNSCAIAKATLPMGDILVCSSELFSLYTTNVVDKASDYIWSISPDSAGSLVPNDTSLTIVWNEAYEGAVLLSVQAKNLCGYGERSDTLHVMRSVVPEKPQIADSNYYEFCSGDSLVLSASGAFAYLWQDESTASTYTVTNSGDYFVKVSNEQGCFAYSDTIRVLVKDTPHIPSILIYGDDVFCAGDSVEIGENNLPKDIYTHLWNTGDTTETIWASSSGQYYHKLISDNGCESDFSDTVSITVNTNPEKPNLSDSLYYEFCEGDSLILSAPDNFLYEWSNGATSQSIAVLYSNDYSVTIIDTNSCSAYSDTVEVQVNDTPNKGSIMVYGEATFCLGDSVEIGPNNLPKDEIISVWNTSETTETIWVYESGFYSYYRISEKGCQGPTSDSVDVEVFENPEIPSIVQNGNVLMVDTAYAYQWYHDLSPVAGLVAIEGENSQTFLPLEDGVFAVEVINEEGCSTVSTSYSFVYVSATTARIKSIEVYPNPSKGRVYIKTKEDIQSIKLYSTDGRLVFVENANCQQININFLPKGYYFMQIELNGQLLHKTLKKD